MSRKRYLGRRGENSDVTRVPSSWGKYDGAFGEIELACDLLHLTIRKAVRLGQHGQRVSAEAPLGKHVTGVVSIFHENGKLAPKIRERSNSLHIPSRNSARLFMTASPVRRSRVDCRLSKPWAHRLWR